MTKQKNITVVIEQHANQIADVSLELICKARELADQLKVGVTAIALGFELKDKLKVLGYYGCDEVYYVDDARLQNYMSVPYAKTVTALVKKYEPQIVLFGATVCGRDLAPRVASELECGLTADCTELEIGDYELKNQKWQNILLQIRPAFGGNIIATIVSPESCPSMATVREGVMKMQAPDVTRSIKIIDEKCSLEKDDLPTAIIEIVRKEKGVNLKAAKIIVAAGMGVSSQESMNLVKELAKTLNAEIGGSRPVIDAGLISHERQVGQTGTTVRPTLYIACGISGQVQHVVGMKEAKRIIAINSDPNAPIFKVAHYGIVGDLNNVIPKMINAYKKGN